MAIVSINASTLIKLISIFRNELNHIQLIIYQPSKSQFMMKQEDIFEEEQEHFYSHKQRHHTTKENPHNSNVFFLTDDMRNTINKRLPRGFSLIKLGDVPKTDPFVGDIQYLPEKRSIRVASQTLAKQFVIQTQLPTTGKRESRGEDKGLRFGQLPEGKSKQGEKIKAIIQKFRKHQKYNTFHQHLTRLGFANAFNEIQNQNRKNIHTIESFKDRSLFLFQKSFEVTYEYDKQNLINEMIDELTFLVENAQKAQFGNSLGLIQKSIDKVTRQMSDIRQTGSYYYRRKKRTEKNYDEKEIVYIADLIRQLPTYELVGIIEIIEEKPFSEITNLKYQFDLNALKHKKIREIQFYVKKKLANHFKSHERKLQKIKNKKKMEKEKEQMKNEKQQVKVEIKNQNDLEFIFEKEEVKEEKEKKKMVEEDEIDSFSMTPHEHRYQDPLNSQQNDDLFAPSQRSSRSDHSPPNMQFQPIPPVPSQQNLEPEDILDSDSSYITEEEDSDF